MINEVAQLKEALLKSNWPACNKLAEQLYEIGTDEAKAALIEGLKGKRHHIRTACIKCLGQFADSSYVSIIEPFLKDSSYETRMEAKKVLQELTGREVLTARGE